MRLLETGHLEGRFKMLGENDYKIRISGMFDEMAGKHTFCPPVCCPKM